MKATTEIRVRNEGRKTYYLVLKNEETKESMPIRIKQTQYEEIFGMEKREIERKHLIEFRMEDSI